MLKLYTAFQFYSYKQDLGYLWVCGNLDGWMVYTGLLGRRYKQVNGGVKL